MRSCRRRGLPSRPPADGAVDPPRPCTEALDIVPARGLSGARFCKPGPPTVALETHPKRIDGCTAGRCRLSGTQARPGMFAHTSFPNLRRRSKDVLNALQGSPGSSSLAKAVQWDRDVHRQALLMPCRFDGAAASNDGCVYQSRAKPLLRGSRHHRTAGLVPVHR